MRVKSNLMSHYFINLINQLKGSSQICSRGDSSRNSLDKSSSISWGNTALISNVAFRSAHRRCSARPGGFVDDTIILTTHLMMVVGPRVSSGYDVLHCRRGRATGYS